MGPCATSARRSLRNPTTAFYLESSKPSSAFQATHETETNQSVSKGPIYRILSEICGGIQREAKGIPLARALSLTRVRKPILLWPLLFAGLVLAQVAAAQAPDTEASGPPHCQHRFSAARSATPHRGAGQAAAPARRLASQDGRRPGSHSQALCDGPLFGYLHLKPRRKWWRRNRNRDVLRVLYKRRDGRRGIRTAK